MCAGLDLARPFELESIRAKCKLNESIRPLRRDSSKPRLLTTEQCVPSMNYRSRRRRMAKICLDAETRLQCKVMLDIATRR